MVKGAASMKQQCPALERPALVKPLFGEQFGRIDCPIDEEVNESGLVSRVGCGRHEWPLNLPVRTSQDEKSKVSAGLREMQKDDRSYVRVSQELLARLVAALSDQPA